MKNKISSFTINEKLNLVTVFYKSELKTSREGIDGITRTNHAEIFKIGCIARVKMNEKTAVLYFKDKKSPLKFAVNKRLEAEFLGKICARKFGDASKVWNFYKVNGNIERNEKTAA